MVRSTAVVRGAVPLARGCADVRVVQSRAGLGRAAHIWRRRARHADAADRRRGEGGSQGDIDSRRLSESVGPVGPSHNPVSGERGLRCVVAKGHMLQGGSCAATSAHAGAEGRGVWRWARIRQQGFCNCARSYMLETLEPAPPWPPPSLTNLFCSTGHAGHLEPKPSLQQGRPQSDGLGGSCQDGCRPQGRERPGQRAEHCWRRTTPSCAAPVVRLSITSRLGYLAAVGVVQAPPGGAGVPPAELASRFVRQTGMLASSETGQFGKVKE